MSSQQAGRSKQRGSSHFQSGRANSRGDDDEEEDDQHSLYDPHSLRIWPAYDTKHLEVLEYPIKELDTTLHLGQSSTSGSTSSSLWLSSQVLGAYLLSSPFLLSLPPSSPRTRRRHAVQSSHSQQDDAKSKPMPKSKPVAVELGAGVGFLSLLLAHAGWEVKATDLPYVARGVLAENVRANEAASGKVEIVELDWQETNEGPLLFLPCSSSAAKSEAYPSLIVSADTLYAPHLVLPFWKTFASLLRSSSSPSRVPLGLLALERRDPAFIDSALSVARSEFGLALTRVEDGKVEQAVQGSLGWEKALWDGVEIWDVRLSGA